MVSAAEYIDELQANGRFCFTTTDEAVAALGVSVPAARAAHPLGGACYPS